MKLKDCKNWKSVRLDDRTILPKDLKYFSREQKEALDNLEVVECSKGRYMVARM